VQQPGIIARERKRLQIEVQPAADGFDIRFFERPQLDEPRAEIVVRRAAQIRNFGWREVRRGEFHVIDTAIDRLHINADAAASGARTRDHSARVRQIEGDPAAQARSDALSTLNAS
jgi:hypothetical protein